MLVVPVLAGLALNAFGLLGPLARPAAGADASGVAPPIFSSPALAALMGLNAAITLALLLAASR